MLPANLSFFRGIIYCYGNIKTVSHENYELDCFLLFNIYRYTLKKIIEWILFFLRVYIYTNTYLELIQFFKNEKKILFQKQIDFYFNKIRIKWLVLYNIEWILT
jgi:hypothetical protein